jgi:hypothetical protein
MFADQFLYILYEEALTRESMDVGTLLQSVQIAILAIFLAISMYLIVTEEALISPLCSKHISVIRSLLSLKGI